MKSEHLQPAAAGAVSEQALREWLIQRIAKQIEVDVSEIDPTQRFDAYGLDSIVAVRIAGDVEKLVKRPLSPALLFEHPTIDELVQYLLTPPQDDVDAA